jgi:hypothetical protein
MFCLRWFIQIRGKNSAVGGWPGIRALEKRSRRCSTKHSCRRRRDGEDLGHKLASFERLDRILASAEARRNNALREIDRHRSALGAAGRQAIDEAEDVEFREVETGEVIAEGQP